MEDQIVAFFIITATAIIYSALSLYITRTLGNRKRVKEIQEEMNRISSGLKKADGTEAKRKEAEKEQGRIPGLMSESMILQFKPLVVILPIFAVVSYLVKTFFPYFQIKLGFSIPTFPYYWMLLRFNLDSFPNWRDEFGTFGWFILCLVFSGIFIQLITDAFEKRRKGK
ncbi:MAG: EMC3/TMCO1 family protein [Candidatus Micrarchaeota archaeon]|nr:EMC3/TMCO1 family protein [Candidatus Micrarchaeota archaeon]